jgi:beta-alanine degradation protein BauB
MATAKDAVTAAPHVYKVVLENDRVRVLEARAQPGGRTEMHSHPANVTIAITDGKYRFTPPDGRTTEAELKAGQAVTSTRWSTPASSWGPANLMPCWSS